MRFSIASGTDNSLLQLISDSSADVEVHTHEIDNHTRPYGIENLEYDGLISSQAAVAPHARTLRGTYVVPANTTGRVDLMHISYIRKTVASAVGLITIETVINILGGVEVNVLKSFMLDNTVGASKVITISPKIILLATDEIKHYTTDLSTGGTIDFQINTVSLEVDA